MLLSQIDRLPTPEQKNALRREAREYRKNLVPQKKAEMDSALCKNILAQEVIRRAKTVLLFSPVKGEPDIMPITEALLSLGVQVAFPISHTDTLTLDFRYVSSQGELISGAYDIPEPPAHAKRVTNTDGAVCLVPALVYDRRGMRIGYGKGYYDRFLSGSRVLSVGVAYSELVTDTLPCEPTDVAVDMIITESGVILPNEKANTQATE